MCAKMLIFNSEGSITHRINPACPAPTCTGLVNIFPKSGNIGIGESRDASFSNHTDNLSTLRNGRLEVIG